MILDLRPLGREIIIVDGNVGLDTSEWKQLKIKIATLVGGGAVTFSTLKAMDEWISQFTNKSDNFPSIIEVEKPKIQVVSK